MLKFFEKIQKSVDKMDKKITENKFMTNPFYKPTNRTFVWTEKSLIFDKYKK